MKEKRTHADLDAMRAAARAKRNLKPVDWEALRREKERGPQPADWEAARASKKRGLVPADLEVMRAIRKNDKINSSIYQAPDRLVYDMPIIRPGTPEAVPKTIKPPTGSHKYPYPIEKHCKYWQSIKIPRDYHGFYYESALEIGYSFAYAGDRTTGLYGSLMFRCP